GHLRDDRHRFEGRNAPLEPLRPLLALLGEAEPPVLAGGVASFAAVSIEQVRGKLLRTLSCRDHFVEGRFCRLRPGRHPNAKNQNHREMLHHPFPMNPTYSASELRL